MAALMKGSILGRTLRNFGINSPKRNFVSTARILSESEQTNEGLKDPLNAPDDENSTEKPSVGGFARSQRLYEDLLQNLSQPETNKTKPTSEEKSFANMLRESQHVHIGTPRGKVVVGTIFHVVKDDLYIDFGGKFHCVCQRPEKDGDQYFKGKKVRLRLHSFEMTDHFIGAPKDVTLLEASAELLGPHLAKSIN